LALGHGQLLQLRRQRGQELPRVDGPFYRRRTTLIPEMFLERRKQPPAAVLGAEVVVAPPQRDGPQQLQVGGGELPLRRNPLEPGGRVLAPVRLEALRQL